MTRSQPTVARICRVAGALVLCLGMLAAPAWAAPKKGKRGPVQGSQTAPLVVPDATDAGAGVVRSTITFGRKFRGQTIGDVDVTVQTTGAIFGAAEELTVRLTAPNGATTRLFNGLGGQSIGPLTLDDDSPVKICGSTSPCTDPAASLVFPYIGTAAPSFSTMRILNRGPIQGTWTLSVLDVFQFGGATSVLNGWSLRIAPHRPVK
jgi:subtilisin-like proprotein convertase family protein